MKELWGFLVKETHHILRDPRTLAILLLIPVAQMLLFGFAVRTDINEIRVVTVDPTPDAASLALRDRFRGTDVFTVVGAVPNVDGLTPLFQKGEIDQAIVFPSDFGRALGRPEGAELLVITDVADPNTGSRMQTYAGAVISGWQRDWAPVAHALRIVPEIRMRFNPTLESTSLFVPGLIAVLLTVVAALMSAISLSREKERGTMEVLLVSPLKPWQIIVGKVAPYMVLGFLNVVSVLLIARLVFDVPFRGSLILLLLESLLFIVTSLALGVLVAAITSTQRTAMVGALMGLMVPTMLLSGMIFPISSMPDWLQPFSNLVPGRWFLLIARGIMLKGIGIEHLWRETLILLGMTLVFLVVAVRRFDYRLS